MALSLEPSSAALQQWVRKCDAELASSAGRPPVRSLVPTATSNHVTCTNWHTCADFRERAAGCPRFCVNLCRACRGAALVRCGSATHTYVPAPGMRPLAAPSTVPSTTQDRPPPLPRLQWFQSATHVTLEVLARGVDPKDATVDIHANSLHVAIRHGDQADYLLDIPALFEEVDVEGSSFSVTKTKLEIRLRKAAQAQWADLQRKPGGGSGTAGPAAAVALPLAPPDEKPAKGPLRNWAKLEAQVRFRSLARSSAVLPL